VLLVVVVVVNRSKSLRSIGMIDASSSLAFALAAPPPPPLMRRPATGHARAT
jgi:hypothetical protein